ncbi:hypothetical protein L202_07919 [Cryptococcus amylolentus CBS 6039]|uniref:Uncharacterized protein n=2 Tax=Cryptococcus amylolentus TaxID=104669 RepID=A0A1E3HAL9_9TREE|nr:hypothetical protein L202_07919 [Cryptococcus amylolentus CBS 6039]ODN73388.1 hypothetical protein L202_07919 [Cryptococcus amylolentus CBS 6039]ODN99166.1 hypothetical protein I350_07325 [Cryptococcus amylolentus CBS 6273]
MIRGHNHHLTHPAPSPAPLSSPTAVDSPRPYKPSTLEFGLNPQSTRHTPVNPYSGLGIQPRTPGSDGNAEGEGEKKRRKSVFSSLKLKKRITRLVSPFVQSNKGPQPQLMATKSDTALPRRPIISSPTPAKTDTSTNPRPHLPRINTHQPTRSRDYNAFLSPEDSVPTGHARGRSGEKANKKKMIEDKRHRMERRASWPLMGPRHRELPLGHDHSEDSPGIQRLVASIYEDPISVQDPSADLKRLKQALDRDIGFTFNVPSLSVASRNRAPPAIKSPAGKHRSHTLRLKHRASKTQNKSGRSSLVLSPEAQEALQRQLARLELRDDALTKSARRLSAMDKMVLQGRGPARHPQAHPGLGRQYSYVSFQDEDGERRVTRVPAAGSLSPASGDMSSSPISPSAAYSAKASNQSSGIGLAAGSPMTEGGRKNRMSMPVMRRRASKAGVRGASAKVFAKPSSSTPSGPATDKWDGNPPSPPPFIQAPTPRVAPMPRPRQKGAPLYNPTNLSLNSKRVNQGRATAPKGYRPQARVEYSRPGATTLAVDQQAPMYSLYAKF